VLGALEEAAIAYKTKYRKTPVLFIDGVKILVKKQRPV